MGFLMKNDPRTIARDIPGIFDAIFPQLTPGVVAYYNKSAVSSSCQPIPDELVQGATIQHSMLFEFGCAVAEQILRGEKVDIGNCLRIATNRQQRHFDAIIPTSVAPIDVQIALKVGENIVSMLDGITGSSPITISPQIPGFQWIATGAGDFAWDVVIIEAKCTSRNFSAPDYRQVIMYWLLSFAKSIESGSVEWSRAILLNPRQAKYVDIVFNEFLEVISAGRTKVEIFQLFSTVIDDFKR